MIDGQKANKRARTRDQILIAAQELLIEGKASSLGIRQVAERAGLVHASFYNYFPDIAALLDGLADLILATHLHSVAPVRAGLSDYALLFAATTRLTLRGFHETPGYSVLLFDSGISIDRLLSGLQDHLRADVRAGIKSGAFAVQNADIAVTIASGSIVSFGLELHRRKAKPQSIDELIAQLLRLLGVPAAKAKSYSAVKLAPVCPLTIPMSWKALGQPAPETARAA